MAERPRLDAVLLDAGGILVRLDYEWMAGTLGALGHPMDPAVLRRAEVEGRRAYDASAAAPHPAPAPDAPIGRAGDITAYFSGMMRAAGVPEPLIAPAWERFDAEQRGPRLWRRPMEGARQALDDLKALGLRLAAVSNSDGRAELHLEEAGVRDGLEFVVDSHVVGVEKPDPAIFRIALDRMRLAPGRALFIGDIRSVDEAGARAAGLHFVLLDPYGDYAAPGSAAIAAMPALAPWIAARYETPTPTGAERDRP